jgi:hypothetical protein
MPKMAKEDNLGLSKEARTAICTIIKAGVCSCMKPHEVGQLMRLVVNRVDDEYRKDKEILAYLTRCLERV